MDAASNGNGVAPEDVEIKLEAAVKEEVEPLDFNGTAKRPIGLDNGYTEEPPAKRGKGTPRGRGRGQAVTASGDASSVKKGAKVVLENIDGVGTPTRGRGRGRGARGGGRGASSTPARSGGRTPKPVIKEEPEDDDDEDDDDDDDEDDDDEDVSEEDEDDEEEFQPSAKKGRGRGRGGATPRGGKAARGKGRGKGASKKSKEIEEDDEEEEEDDEDDEESERRAAEELANDPNAITTGQFLVDLKDKRTLESYPIWRMEGPNMLRKFEMIVQLGRIRHKSLYAYSSWAQSMKDLFEVLQVTQISSMDGDSIVEIQDDSLPKSVDISVLEGKFGGHEMLPMFESLLMTLFGQVADSNLLKNAYLNDDANVLGPIKQVDAIVQDRRARIEAVVSIKEDFKNRVRDCPKMKSIRRTNWSQTDQATNDRSMEKGVRSVLLFGFGYDPNTLAEDKSRGAEVAQEVVVGETMDKYLSAYHGLYHIKYHLLERCSNKAKMLRDLTDQEPSLEKLMEDRCWIFMAFEDFLNMAELEKLE